MTARVSNPEYGTLEEMHHTLLLVEVGLVTQIIQ
jgi:hypothetical protein